MKPKPKTERVSHNDSSLDLTLFSVVQLPVDQNSNITSQRILQAVTKGGLTKLYVTESAYFKSEMYKFLSDFIDSSYVESIQKRMKALKPVAGGRYWIHFDPDMTNPNFDWPEKSKRVNPEKFE